MPRRKKQDISAINVFDYLDYRKYLQDRVEELQRIKRRFSYRSFAEESGIPSFNYLLLVKEGKRNLTDKYIEIFAKALHMTKAEKEYFAHLVGMNQSTDRDKRTDHYREMLRVANRNGYAVLDAAQFQCYEQWYIPAIREMTELKDFNPDPEWIATRLNPPVSVQQVKNALEILRKIGFIDEENGKFKKTERSLTTGPETRSILLRKFHDTMIALAGEAQDRIAPEQREIASMTLSLTKEQFIEFKNELFAFRQRMLERFTSDQPTDGVYQFNVQLFPLTGNTESNPPFVENENDHDEE